MIAFFHTLSKNIERFDAIIQKIDPKIEVQHFVNEKILSTVMNEGKISSAVRQIFQTGIKKIQQLQPDLIICTCSTFGEECKNISSEGIEVMRIDQPIVEYMVGKYSKILMAYTAQSTINISRDLLLEVSAKLNKEIEIFECDCSKSWYYFLEGKQDQYEKTIAQKIQLCHKKAEVIYLAQASMEGAKKQLTNISKEILSSSEYGVKYYLNKTLGQSTSSK